MTPAAIPATLDSFREIWAIDFEFIASPGERPTPICCVARELRTGRELRTWGCEEMRRQGSPIPRGALMVAYYASAELGCFKVLGWSMPTHVLDLFAEFRTFANGRDGALGIQGASLLAALAHFGLSHLDQQQKDQWRERIMQGPPFTRDEQHGIVEYCASDVEALAQLLPCLVERLHGRQHWLPHALLRGRYMVAAAAMEHNGIPIDLRTLKRLATNWDVIKGKLIDDIRGAYPIFDGVTLRMELFERWLVQHGIPWPRTETGSLSLAEGTFKTMARAYPIVAPIREVRENLAALRLNDLAVGADGRNRTMLSALRSRTGRNQPSNAKSIFGPATWLRSLIRPRRGRAIAYVDYTSQEIGIAAALSGDQALMRAYRSGDPYMAFAVDAGLAPPGATKATHNPIRDRCKALVLGVLYGMQESTLAGNLNVPTCEARELLRAHKRTYMTFWAWSQRVVDTAMLRGWIDTVFGWRLHVTSDTRPTSLLNHPMQSNGAEMLRLACCYLIEADIKVCAPIHDAVLIEAPVREIDAAVKETQRLMRKASRVVLGGFEIRTDAEIVRYPNRYIDERGVEMWQRVMALLDLCAAQELSAFPSVDARRPTSPYPSYARGIS